MTNCTYNVYLDFYSRELVTNLEMANLIRGNDPTYFSLIDADYKSTLETITSKLQCRVLI